jgi:hypothetical protein
MRARGTDTSDFARQLRAHGTPQRSERPNISPGTER